MQMSRARDAHSSPRRKCLAGLLSRGLLVKRAETAQTDRTRTGGKELFLDGEEISAGRCMVEEGVAVAHGQGGTLPQLSHVAWLVQQVIGLAINVIEEHLGEVLLNVLGGEHLGAFAEQLRLLCFLDLEG